MKRSTTKEFKEKANVVHGNNYIYDKVEYVNTYTQVTIMCPEHGEFTQTPNCHLSGSGCPKCAGKFMDRDYFIEKANVVHGNNYIYDKVEYVNTDTKVTIICPEHGEFTQIPHNHLSGKGCPKCAGTFMDRDYFIEKANVVHGNKYIYDKVEYVNTHTKVTIICPEHGEFAQTPRDHLSGKGCPKCAGTFMDRDYFIEKANVVHGNKYIYDKVEYVNTHIKVTIICPEHGEFTQTPSNHLNGKGCPKCNYSHGERYFYEQLELSNIKYDPQKTYDDLKGLGDGLLSYDFYLPEYNTLVEIDGVQHYNEKCGWHQKEEDWTIRQIHDEAKNEYAENNRIELIRIPYLNGVNDEFKVQVQQTIDQIKNAAVAQLVER